MTEKQCAVQKGSHGDIWQAGLPLLWALSWSAISIAQPPATVVLAPVQEMSADSTEEAFAVTFVGDVIAIRQATIHAKEPGGVVEFPHREGEYVQEGEILCVQDSRILEMELAEAKAMSEVRQTELQELERGTRIETKQAARAKYEAAMARKTLEDQLLRRAESLFRRNSASTEEVDEATSRSLAATAAADQAKAELDEAENGPRRETIEQARARLKAQQAAVERLERQMTRKTLRAPFNGFIIREYTQIGAVLQPGDPAVEFVEMDQVDIKVLVQTRFAGQIKPGMKGAVELDSLNNQRLEGEVKLVIPSADPASRLFPVRVRLNNPMRDGQPLLHCGMLARVRFPFSRLTGQPLVVVPKDALVLGKGNPLVYVVRELADPMDASKKQAMAFPISVQPIKTFRPGPADPPATVLSGDLKPGEQVVVQGNERLLGLPSGQPVMIAK